MRVKFSYKEKPHLDVEVEGEVEITISEQGVNIKPTMHPIYHIRAPKTLSEIKMNEDE